MLIAESGKVHLHGVVTRDVVHVSDGFHDSFPRISSRRSVRQRESFVRSFVQSCFR